MSFMTGLRRVKEWYDVVGDVPGIAAFVKTYFGEKGEPGKIHKRLLVDLRHEFAEEVALLPPDLQDKFLERLAEEQAKGTEDWLVRDLSKLPREIRKEWMLKWISIRSGDNKKFASFWGLLRDDKVRQWSIRQEHAYALRRVCAIRRRAFGGGPLTIAQVEEIINPEIRPEEMAALFSELTAERDLLRESAQRKGWRAWMDC